MDTIFALASAQGRAGVSVVRISGLDAFKVGSELCRDLPGPRQSALRVLRSQDGKTIDQALVLAFLGPNSFTGEDTVELHTHGSVAVVRMLLRTLSAFDGCRLAEPGEFTRRALENGKLDLAQVEGLADLIDAETEAQRKQAFRVLSGALGQKVEAWRGYLIRAASLLEATIDFADEDVPVDVSPEVKDLLERVIVDLTAEIAGTHVAERIRSGFEVAIIGPPNVGKSSLLNAISGRDAAITSEIAGTTRDVIEVRMDLGGVPVTLLDTAGLHDSNDTVEAIGIARALNRAANADLRIFLIEDGTQVDVDRLDSDIVVRPKADIRSDKKDAVSGITGAGVSELIQKIQSVLVERSSGVSLATHERHRLAMERAHADLMAASQIVGQGTDAYDIAAEELRSAIRALEGLVGRIDVESLLDEIFLSFCIGK